MSSGKYLSQALFGLALMLAGIFLIGQAVTAYDDWQSLLLLIGGACTVRTSWPLLVKGLGLNGRDKNER